MKTIIPTLTIALLLAGFETFAQDIHQELVSYWTFDEVTETTAPDLAFGNDFTLNGITSANVVAGQRANALSFSGGASGGYLSMVHTTSNVETGIPISRSGRYTIMMWVKADAQTARYLYAEGSSANDNPLFLIQTGQTAANNNKLDVIIRTPTTGTVINHVVTTNVVFDDTWHHIAWVDDLGSVQVYVDGNLDPANFNYTHVDGALMVDRTAMGTLIRAAVHSSRFNGLIDDVAIWERPLSQAEVQEVMNNGLATPIPGFAPQITVQPGPPAITQKVGDRLSLTVLAIGNRPFSYEWRKGETPIPGGTDQTLTLSGLTPDDSGVYSVVVGNAFGSTPSETVTLTVDPDPAPDLTQGVIHYWPLDTVTDSFTPDLASGAHMQVNNMDAGNLIAGQFGSALTFDGSEESEEYANRVGGIPIYNNNSTYSIALWVRGFPQNDRRVFAEASTAVNPLFNIGTQSSGATGQLRMFIRNDNGALVLNRNSTSTPFDGDWHHIVWVDESGAGKLYVDGVLDGTDFDYTRGELTPTTTSIGGILRATPITLFAGDIDEVGVWNRRVTFTEIQEMIATGIPDPPPVIPPSVATHPQSASVFTGSTVTLSVAATGTVPLSYQWHKGGLPISGATDDTYTLTNVQLSDAGDYHVVVANTADSAASNVATVEVSQRPPTPSEIRIDINHTGAETVDDTEDGFESFTIAGTGQGLNFRALASGIEVTMSSAGGINIESRNRTTMVNAGEFTETKLLKDFVFSRDTTEAQGINLELAFLKPDQHYTVTIWSYDRDSTGNNNRVSDWVANGELVLEGYSFVGTQATPPVSNDQYRFNFNIAADSEGKILIQARKSSAAEGNLNCFINALALVESEPTGSLRVTGMGVSGGSVQLTIETSNPSWPLHIEETPDIGSPSWSEVAGVNFSEPNDNVIQATFPVPAGTSFYRAVTVPPVAPLSDDFEGDEQGWTTGGTGSPPWEKGTPAPGQGPGEAHSGTTCWAVGLTTPYSPSSELWLRSPSVNLTELAAAQLEFWEFRSVDDLFAGSFFVHYTLVSVKDASTGDLIAELAQNAGQQTQWTKRTFALPPEAFGKSVIIEFLLVSDSVPAPSDRHGWFIDDVMVVP